MTPEPSGEEEQNGRLNIFRKRVRRSGGFLLDSTLPSRRSASPAAEDKTPAKEQQQQQVNGKGKAVSNRLSGISSQSSAAPSPLSRQIQRESGRVQQSHGLDGSTSVPAQQETRNGTPNSTSSTPLDPAQLVQMALSLSEGRRRHASANLTIPSTAATDSRRIRSAGAPVLSIAPGSPLGNDFLRPQSAPDHPSSPHTPRTPSRLSQEQEQHGSTRRRFDNGAAEAEDESLEDLAEEDEVEFQFSAATLNRAERARKFSELSSEYWRLLQNLPPLKSDSTARGNYTFVTQNSPGSTYPQINRIRSNTDAKHELGRQYNPLQLLRNRRIRHREQRPLDPPADAFNDVAKVSAYIDEVATDSKQPAYRNIADTISLPHFRRGSLSEGAHSTPAKSGHKRTDTTTSRISRAGTDWSFTPAELFADALWLEQDDNKTLIENRHGNRIFPQLARAASYESMRDERKSKESVRSSLERTNTRDSTAIKSDDETGRRGRKKRKFLSLRKVEDTARKHLIGRRTRSNSASSDSSPTKRERQRRALRTEDDPDHETIGPLERHMRIMMEKEKGTPELISPDKWDRPEELRTTPSRDATASANADLTAKTSELRHSRNESSKTDDHARLEDRGRSSFDDSTAPNSPAVARFIPPIGMSLSPPQSRKPSPERKFGIFRAGSKERYKIDQIDFANSHVSLPSPAETHDEPVEPPRSSFESLRPSMIKRHKTKSSLSNTLFRSDTSTPQIERRGSKDTAASRRFFKGGRLGDLVRSEGSRFGDVVWKKEQPRADASDVSDTESDGSVEHGGPRKLKKPPTNLSRTSTASGGQPKYHIPNLPSFRPQNASKDEHDVSPDPLAQQGRSHRENSHSSHLDHLAPPRITLPDYESDTSPGLSRQHTRTTDLTAGSPETDRRGSYGFLTPLRRNQSSQFSMGAPGSIGYGDNIYMTGLANLDQQASRKMSTALQGKRHWSISDRIPREAEAQQVTAQDIDRVRALFLSSGIKAHELCKRANSVIDPPSDLFANAAHQTGQQVHPVTWREEFIFAARMLSKSVSSWCSGLEHDIDTFRSDTVPGLHSQLEEIKHRVEERLTPLVHQTADEADAFTVALTTQQTLAIKQVNDAIDSILRRRRRKLRMLRRAGFAVLEWVVLGLLWVVWFVVIIIKLVKGVVLGFTKATRWVLCL